VSGKSIVVVGLGNIGSHFVPHAARMENVTRIVLIDAQTYEVRNCLDQDTLLSDAAQPKAIAQARRLIAIRPDLEVHAVHAPLESVPLALWRAHLIVACLDSREARQGVNARARHLGAAWFVDTGVLASQSLARVNVYAPDPDAPCLECPWSEDDYRLLEQRYPCALGGETPLPTGAPSALGALAASLAALECRKLLNDDREHALIGRQLVYAANSHHAVVTRFARNPACRFDHARWTVEPLIWDLREKRMADLIAFGGGVAAIPGHRFVRRRVCPRCGAARQLFHLEGSLPRAFVACYVCGDTTVTPGFDVVETLTADLPADVLGMTLADAGLRAGEIVCARKRHFEIAGNAVIGGER